MALTDAGRALLPLARQAVNSADHAGETLRGLASGRSGLLRVGVMGHGSGEVTTEILRGFQHRHPEISVRVTALDFTEHLTSLLERKVDVAFVRPELGDPRLRELVLTTEPRIVIVPDSHVIADAPSVSVDEALEEEFVGRVSGGETSWKAGWDVMSVATGWVPTPRSWAATGRVVTWREIEHFLSPNVTTCLYADFPYLAADRNGGAPRTSPHTGRNPGRVCGTYRSKMRRRPRPPSPQGRTTEAPRSTGSSESPSRSSGSIPRDPPSRTPPATPRAR